MGLVLLFSQNLLYILKPPPPLFFLDVRFYRKGKEQINIIILNNLFPHNVMYFNSVRKLLSLKEFLRKKIKIKKG